MHGRLRVLGRMAESAVMTYLRLEREQHLLVVERDGCDRQLLRWPEHCVAAQDELLAGRMGGWLAGAPGLSDDEVATRVRQFGKSAYDSFGRAMIQGLPEGDRLYVDCGAGAHQLPLEAIAVPPTYWHMAVAPRGHSVIRTVGRPTDTPLWSANSRLRVLFVDWLAGDGHSREHRRAIEECVDLGAGEFRYLAATSPLDLVSGLEWEPSVVHLLAHGVDGGGAVLLGDHPDCAMPVSDVARAFQEHRVRVVLLNTCESSAETVPDASLAELLLGVGVPAVIAARRRVGTSAMAAFAQGFFSNLASGEVLDECVRQGRRFMANDQRPLHHCVLTFHASTTDLSPHPANTPRIVKAIERAIEQSWRRTRRNLPFVPLEPTPIASPSALIRPLSRSMPFVGRNDEVRQLRAWRDRLDRLSVFAVVGAGGLGKTRLALEFIEESARQGWIGGFIGRSRGREAIEALESTRANLLVVVDDAETSREFVLDLIDSFHNGPESLQLVRILLVMSIPPPNEQWLDPFLLDATESIEVYLQHADVLELTHQALALSERNLLLSRCLREFALLLGLRSPSSTLVQPAESPLEIGMQALSMLLDESAFADVLRSVLLHERRVWMKSSPVPPHVTDQVAVIATLFGAVDVEILAEKLSHIVELTLEVGAIEKAATWSTRLIRAGRLRQDAALVETHLRDVLKSHPNLVEVLREGRRRVDSVLPDGVS